MSGMKMIVEGGRDLWQRENRPVGGEKGETVEASPERGADGDILGSRGEIAFCGGGNGKVVLGEGRSEGKGGRQ